MPRYHEKMSLKNGSYTGEGEEYVVTGLGQANWNDGSSYRGEFKQGKLNGLGTMIRQDGTKQSGKWEENNLQGFGNTESAQGWEHSGHYKDNKRDGVGRLSMPGKYLYEGTFKGDKKHGVGKITYLRDEDSPGTYFGEFDEVCQTERVGDSTKTLDIRLLVNLRMAERLENVRSLKHTNLQSSPTMWMEYLRGSKTLPLSLKNPEKKIRSSENRLRNIKHRWLISKVRASRTCLRKN